MCMEYSDQPDEYTEVGAYMYYMSIDGHIHVYVSQRPLKLRYGSSSSVWKRATVRNIAYYKDRHRVAEP